MRRLLHAMAALALVLPLNLAAQGSSAADNLTTFPTGGAATAAQVNGNFGAILAAIVGNSSNIAELQQALNESSVAGKTYRLQSIRTLMDADEGNNAAAYGIGTSDNLLVFDASTLTGTIQILDNATQDSVLDIASRTISSVVEPAALIPFTYSQVGNTVTLVIQEEGESESIDFVLAPGALALIGSFGSKELIASGSTTGRVETEVEFFVGLLEPQQ